MIRQDDLLKTLVETVVKRIATLEKESGGVLKVASVSEPSGKVNPTGADKQVSEIEEMVNKAVELKLEEFRSSQGPLSGRGEPAIFKYSWFGDQRFSSLSCFNNSPAHYCSWGSVSKFGAGWCTNKMEFSRG